MVVCDRCNSPYHKECQEAVAPAGRGPWYCGLCRGWLLLHGTTDPVEDIPLLDYLFRGIAPDDEREYARVKRLSLQY